MARERKFSTEELFQAAKQLLLDHGYEGFTFALLAERLNVARATLYKYYENKDELITDYMIDEMNHFLIDLKNIHQHDNFRAQFDFLLTIIFKHDAIHKIIGMVTQIPRHTNERVKANREQLDQLHLNMYTELKAFIQLGRAEKVLKPHLNEAIILGMIFQTIAIPNHFGIPKIEWVQSIKEILSNGMFN